ncbi:MAG: 4-hydroxythreonine-4-phosphate dehydrogenase PdxA [Kangiellaceae bacterium]|nr:4-hydroxythreonine-4-phosphate dehydrogenase PdxA [Kangiellaceae bacterium]
MSPLSAALQTPRILITAGEPAGIGPEILVKLAQQPHSAQLIACASKQLLLDTAQWLELPLSLTDFDATQPAKPHHAGHLSIIDSPLLAYNVIGQLNPDNAQYVINTLNIAAQMAMSKQVDAILTGPVHKGVINQSGLKFSGHTEFFAETSNTEKVVMMLATDGLRVTLATTHLPLRQVADAITPQLLEQVLTIIVKEMQHKFAIAKPKILVCGLNPHAGEDGHLGMEEIEVIIPTLERLRDQLNADLIGPIPADTAFKPNLLEQVDCVLAMYHDQGLPTLKHKGFGNAINMTLGLPFIRTSVDHGTGLDIAGKNIADVGSMQYALQFTLDLIQRQTS